MEKKGLKVLEIDDYKKDAGNKYRNMFVCQWIGMNEKKHLGLFQSNVKGL